MGAIAASSHHWITEVCSQRHIEFKTIGMLEPFNTINGKLFFWLTVTTNMQTIRYMNSVTNQLFADTQCANPGGSAFVI